MQKITPLIATLAVSIFVTGCGQSSNESEAPQSEATTTETDNTNPPASGGDAPQTNRNSISVEDIDRWQRGMEAELKAVQEAAAKLAQAKDDNEKLEALHATTEMGTIDAAAQAAGVDRDSYRRIRNTFANAVSQLSPIESEMDVTQMPAEMVEQMRQAREAGVKQLENELPADVMNALKSRALELRTQEKMLVAERLKVATSAR